MNETQHGTTQSVLLEGETLFILDLIPFQPEFDTLRRRVRLKEDSPYLAELHTLYQEARAIARPKAMIRLAWIEAKHDDSVIVDGVHLKSRVLRVNLEHAQRIFAYAATCGMELHRMEAQLDDMLQRYWLDVLKEMALGEALQTLDAFITQRFRPTRTATMAPGSLADWPISQQRALFNILGAPEAAIGIQLTESYLMIPNKSVSGIRFPTEESFESCQLCPREGCPNRRAPYEPGLYESRYARGDTPTPLGSTL